MVCASSMNRMIGVRRGLDLGDDRLEPVLELALHAGAGLQQRQVERAERDVAERRRHVARRDAQREAFDHGRLADARLAGEDRVVLPPARQDVDHLPDLEVAAEHRVDLALPGARGQVDGVLVERRASSPTAAVRAGAPSTTLGAWYASSTEPAIELPEALGQGLDGDLRELGARLRGEPGQVGIREQREEEMPGADRRAPSSIDASIHASLSSA